MKNDAAAEKKWNVPITAESIRHAYTKEYYLTDCGGFETFQKTNGKKIQDARLQVMANLSLLRDQGLALDLGCGRGELTYYLAKRGHEVTAIDYSPDAVALTLSCFDGEPKLLLKTSIGCEDVCTMNLVNNYNLVLAADIIEHLAPSELDILYNKVANHLQDDGLFIVHTFPNKWFYDYEYRRKRRIAALSGKHLPAEPRSQYEKLMHINEQSPRVMKKQLQKHFPHVLMWLATIDNPLGTLMKSSIAAMRAAPDIFAIASHKPVDAELVKVILSMNALPEMTKKQLSLSVQKFPKAVAASTSFALNVLINNKSPYLLNSFAPNPVHLSYHWYDKRGKTPVMYDGVRSKLLPGLVPTNENVYDMQIEAPTTPGWYRLNVTLVQEGVRWFDAQRKPIVVEKKIQVI